MNRTVGKLLESVVSTLLYGLATILADAITNYYITFLNYFRVAWKGLLSKILRYIEN